MNWDKWKQWESHKLNGQIKNKYAGADNIQSEILQEPNNEIAVLLKKHIKLLFNISLHSQGL